MQESIMHAGSIIIRRVYRGTHDRYEPIMCQPEPLPDPSEVSEAQVAEKRWNLVSLIGFRFVFCYFSLFNLDYFLDLFASALMKLPGFIQAPVHFLLNGNKSIWHAAIPWVGQNLFHINNKFTDCGWAPADSTYGWLRVFCIFSVSLFATALWSALDRRRSNYERLQVWFRLCLRLVLAQALILYGMQKVIKTQFPDISPATLEKTYAAETPMGLLWTFMGYSGGYNLFTGLAEVIPGLIILMPRLTLIGSLLSAAVMTNVFMLNVFYDVRVKLYSMHLLLMAIVLILPDTPRLFSFFFSNQTVSQRQEPAFFKNARLNLAVVVCLILSGISALVDQTHMSLAVRKTMTDRSPLDGTWTVTEFRSNGKILPLDRDDKLAWEKIVSIDKRWIIVKGTDETKAQLYVEQSKDRKNLALGRISNFSDYYSSAWAGKEFKPKWSQRWQFRAERPRSDDLSLSCPDYCGFNVEMKLHRIDPATQPLLNQKFRWVTDPEEYGAK